MSEPQSSEADPVPGEPAAPRGSDGERTTTPCPHGEAALPVEVAVTRSGGFAGLTKRWTVEPAPDEASVWIDLIAQCPWDATAAGVDPARGDTADGRPPAGADRFTWWIRARCGEKHDREAELPDEEVVGAWRDLIDAVRERSRPARA